MNEKELLSTLMLLKQQYLLTARDINDKYINSDLPESQMEKKQKILKQHFQKQLFEKIVGDEGIY